MLTNDQILRIAAAELAEAYGKEAIAEGQHAVQAAVSMRLIGHVEQQPVQLVTPTVKIPLLSVLALICQGAGLSVTRTADRIVEACTLAIEHDAAGGEWLEVTKAAERKARDLILEKLPKIERSGPLRRIVEVSDIDVHAISFSQDKPPAKSRRRK